MSAPWTQRPRRIFQHLLREQDAIGIDPAELIAEAVAMKADTYLCMGGGFSAWYPTEVEGQVRNPYLEDDLVGRVVDAAHRSGLRVLFRMDISKGRPGADTEAPDLYCRTADGEIPMVWGMPQVCPTGPIWEGRNFAILKEVLGRYELDGLFYNYFTVPACHCDRCTSIVLGQTGAPPPTTGRTYPHEAWRARHLATYTHRLRETIQGLRPGACLVPYHHVHSGWDRRAMADACDLVATQISNPLVVNPVDPQPVWSLWAMEEVHLDRAMKPGIAPIAVQSGSGFFASRQTALSGWRLTRNLLLAAASGGGTAVALNGRLTQDDPRLAKPLTALTGHLSRNRDWYKGLISVARIAVLRSDASIAWGPDQGVLSGGAAGGHVHEFRGVCEMLSALRRPFDILPADGIGLSELGHYDVVLAPNLCCLADADAETLDAFVEQGGSLTATGAFGSADIDGQRRSAPVSAAMARLPEAARSVDGGYFQIADTALGMALSGTPRIGASGLFHDVCAEQGWQRELMLVEPAKNNAPEFTIVAAPGDAAGWIARQHGDGQVDWLPWYPGSLFHRTGFTDLLAVFDRLMAPAGSAPIRSNAPIAADITLYRHPKGAVLHVFNSAAHHGRPITDAVPLAGFDIEVDWQVDRAVALSEGDATVIEPTETGVRLRLPRLDDFAAFALFEANPEIATMTPGKGA